MNLRIVIAIASLISCGKAVAQIQVDRLYPPCVSAGQETIVQAEGKFPQWPVSFVCDRDDVQIVAADESGKLKITLPSSASPGLAWVRLYDESSASKLMPLLIEPIPAKSEVEPNNKIAEATSVASTDVIYGRLEKNGDVDTFRVNAKRGETFVVSAIANRYLRSPMDMVLQLVDKQGNVLEQVDDVCGIDPQVSYIVDEDIEIFVRIFAFPETPNSTISYAGAASFVYELRVTNQSFVDYVIPLVVGSDQEKPLLVGWNLSDANVPIRVSSTTFSVSTIHSQGALGWQQQISGPINALDIIESADGAVLSAESVPFIFSGHIAKPSEVDRVRFTGKKSTKYQARIHSRAFGFPLDSVLTVSKAGEKDVVARNDDRERDVADSSVEFTVSDDGEYELSVADLVDGFGPRHAYSVVVEESLPVVELVIAEDHLTMKAGDSVDIAVSIQRKNGFDKKLKVVCENLPERVTSELVFSEPKGDSSKDVTLKLIAEKDAKFSGNFQIVAQPFDASDNASGPVVTAIHQLNSLTKLKDIWLTVVAAP